MNPTDKTQFANSVSQALQETHSPRSSLFIWFVCLLLVALIIWASLAEMDEFAHGTGSVVPSQTVQKIQNLEGGILSEVLVREGDIVEAGQLLLRIDDTSHGASFREQEVQRDYLEARIERLIAEANMTPYQPQIANDFVQDEVELYNIRQRSHKQQMERLIQRAQQKRLELQELAVQTERLTKNVSLMNEEYDLTAPMVNSGAVSEVELNRLTRSLNEATSELAGAKISKPRLEAELDEILAEQQATELNVQAEAQQALNDAQNEFARLSETASAAGDRVDRTAVRASVRGTIKKININTIGGVIQPGMDLIELVPLEDQLVVEVKVRPQDIAYIHPQQKALVKITAYDFSIYGGLDAHVVHISPDTLATEEGETYYLVRLLTEGQIQTKTGNPLPIIPGMVVEAGINTGSKTMLDYLLKPILKTKQNAFTER